MATLIGISGKKHSGKTSTANVIIRLTKQYNPIRFKEWQIKSFAEPVKRVCSYIACESYELYLNDKTKKEEAFDNVTRREFMTILGTDIARKVNSDIWINFMDKHIINREGKPYLIKNTIIDDVRFVNEANYIKNNGGILIRLVGDPGGLEDGLNSNHVSETELDDYPFEYVLDTNEIGTKAFVKKVQDVLSINKLI